MLYRPVILAIDPSGAATGWACGRAGQKPFLGTVHFKKDETDGEPEIFGRATSWILDRLEKTEPDVLAIEEPMVVHNPMIICGVFAILIGAWRAKCRGRKIRVVRPATWRKYFLGSGTLSGVQAKADSVRLARQLGWADLTQGHDACEASGLWAYAEACELPKHARRIEPLFARAAE